MATRQEFKPPKITEQAETIERLLEAISALGWGVANGSMSITPQSFKDVLSVELKLIFTGKMPK